jgi:hypothetical protein
MVRSNLRAHFKSKDEFDCEMDRIERALAAEEYRREAATRVMNAALARWGWKQDGAGRAVYVGHEG